MMGIFGKAGRAADRAISRTAKSAVRKVGTALFGTQKRPRPVKKRKTR